MLRRIIRSNVYLVLLFCSLVMPVQAATLASIAVTPVNSTVNVGQTQQYTANGTFDDNTSHILSYVASVAAGETHTCAALADGTVKCWGKNTYGQLGNGSTTDSSTPITVPNLSNVQAVSSGWTHTCAVLTDGTAKCWGSNSSGQLGNGSMTNSPTPVTVTGLANVQAVSSGTDHTCAVLTDGTVKCWGDNGYGQLGDGSMSKSPTPVIVTGLANVQAVSSGQTHTCAVLNDGTVKCWGWNNYGQLGNGSTTQSSTPVTVNRLANVRAVSSGINHTCAALTDGTVKCWGQSGQLGNGSTTDSSTPVTVTGLANVQAVSSAQYHTCVTLTDGTSQCWGWNQWGQLGNGSTTDSATPVTVFGLANVQAVSSGTQHTCAVLTDGTVKCWGNSYSDQLGNDNLIHSTTPVPVLDLANVQAVSNGMNHACAVLNDGTVKCWGRNQYGQLGNGSTTDSTTPVTVSGLANVLTVNGGRYHTCAVLSGGTVKCWGWNLYGQLGNGSTTDSSTPVTVVTDPVTMTALSNALALNSGGDYSCARLGDGTVKCWGFNGFGQLGNGSITDSSTPVTVVTDPDTMTALSNVRVLGGGSNHACALFTDSTTLKCWGYNGSGQLGNGSSGTSSYTPVTVVTDTATMTPLSNVVAVDGGEYHTCAILSDGTVKCWGHSRGDSLFDSSKGTKEWWVGFASSTPVTTGPDNVRALSVGWNHACATLTTDGTVKCWASNHFGQLGNGSTTDSSTPITPTTVTGLTNVRTLNDGRGYHTCAVLTDNTVKCWGYNDSGQLGNGRMGYPIYPTPVATVGLPAKVIWASSSPSVATIDSNGLVTALSSGATTITATSGSISGSTSLVVNVPDLIVSAISTTATTVAPGATLSLTNAAKNQGGSSAGSFVIAFHLSTDATYGGTDDIAFTTTRTVASLGAGLTNSLATTLTVPATTPLGFYYLCASTDVNNTVVEGSEGNNSRCTDTPIKVAYPDLTVSALSMTATTVNGGGTLAASHTVTNSGEGPAGTSTTAFRLSTNTTYGDADDVVITTTQAVAALAPGAALSYSTNLLIPTTAQAGTYYLCAKADNLLSVAEANEANNSRCTSTTVTLPPPDLIVSAISSTATTVGPGAPLSLTNAAKNQGGSLAGSFVIAFSLSTDAVYGGRDDIAFTTTRTVASLGAGLTNSLATTLTVPTTTPVGFYYLCASTDVNNTVVEGIEGNNAACTATSIKVAYPDLTISALSMTATTVNGGGTLAASHTVTNGGEGPAGASTTAFRLSTNTTFGDTDDVVITTTQAVAALAPGAALSYSTNLLIPVTVKVGTYYLCAKADNPLSVAEANEANNSRCTSTTVTPPPPDLIVSAISSTATTGNAGSTVALSNSVKNQGGSAAGSSIVAFRLSVNTVYGDADDIVSTTTRTIASLNTGETNTVSTSVLIPATTPSGTYYLCAKADNTNTVLESGEANNTACTTTTITVPPPDLAMTALSTTATTVAKGAKFALSNTVKNQGGIAAGAFAIGFMLSVNNVIGDGDDIALTPQRSVTSLTASASSAASTSVTVPLSTPSGSYYIGAMADVNGTVTEGNEGNNTRVTVGMIAVP